MFEYTKDTLMNEIDIDNEKLDNQKSKKRKIEKEVYKISEFRILKSKINHEIKNVIGLYLALIPTVILLSVNMSLFSVATNLGVLLMIAKIRLNISNYKDILKSMYAEYLDLTKLELKEQEEVLFEQIKMVEYNIEKINTRIAENNELLCDIENYEISDNIYSDGVYSFLKESKTQEDYDLACHIEEICKTNFIENYLNEKVDYSGVHFNSYLKEENSKKLVKKL